MGDQPHVPTTREELQIALIRAAGLERAIVEVHDGPGAEDRELDSSRRLASLALEALFSRRPVLNPTLTRFRYPVAAYLEAVKSGQDPALPRSGDSSVALYGATYKVRIRDQSSPQCRLLDQLTRGGTLTDAVYCASTPADDPLTPARVGGWLEDWGLFVDGAGSHPFASR